jgi:acyl carrier protein
MRQHSHTERDDVVEAELKHLIVDVLMLEDVRAEEIDSDAPLFHEGLGLDSIDSLDLAMALEERYGVRTAKDSAETRRHFACVRALAAFVAANRNK